MKIKITIIATLLFIFLPAKYLSAQLFQDIGNNWYYEVKASVGCFPCVNEFQKIEYITDTVIHDISCKVLYKSGTLTPCSDNDSMEEYVYESNGNVFWYNKWTSEFTLLYNFQAIAGDSWNITVADCNFDVTVDSITFSDYSGQTFKNLHISDENNYFTGKLTENIGHSVSFFPRDVYWLCRYGGFCDAPFINGLRCFNTLTQSYILMDLECDTVYVTALKEIALNKLFFAFPNPSSQYVTFNNPESLTGTIVIRDVFGRVCKEIELDGADANWIIDVKPGFYFYTITSINGVGKLIIEDK